MAAFDTTRPSSSGIGSGRGLNGVVHSLLSAFTDWNDRRATRKTLNQLSDRELADIGLVRGDINNISR
ncbi:MAG: DUF1127 domain-containing protein [Paracoccaceae bacterium]